MNVADLVAKIQIEVDKKELSKLPETLDQVKDKVEELGEKFEENTEIQKEAGKETEKLAAKTSKASKVFKAFATIFKGIVVVVKAALSVMHGFLGIVLKTASAMSGLVFNWASRGAQSLEQMYEKAGKLGASLRLLSTEFGVTPEVLQRWQVLAESAGTSKEAMNGILSSVTQLRRDAIKNPLAAPDALLYAGIRPSAYGSDEALLNAILRAAGRFRNERARLAWLEDAGIGDAASFNLLLKQWQKGQNVDSHYLISNENVEKLSLLKAELSKFETLSEAIKNNFLAAISDSFIKQLQRVSEILIDSIKTVEGFIARHGGFEKVFGDISGIFNKIVPLGNSLAAVVKVIEQFGAFTTTIITFGVALGAIVKVADMLVESFTKAVGLVGTLKELFYGFAAMKIQEAIDSGAISDEYLPEAQKAQNFFKAGAGVYQDPKLVSKGLSDILSWLYSLPQELASKLASLIGNVLYSTIDYLIDQIITLWAYSDLPFSDWARDKLASRYMSYGNRTEEQEAFLKDYYSGVYNKFNENLKNAGNYQAYARWFGGGLKGSFEQISQANWAATTLKELFGTGKEVSGDQALQIKALLDIIKKDNLKQFMNPNEKDRVNHIEQVFNFSNYNASDNQNLPYRVGVAAKNGTSNGLKEAQAIGTGN